MSTYRCAGEEEPSAGVDGAHEGAVLLTAHILQQMRLIVDGKVKLEPLEGGLVDDVACGALVRRDHHVHLVEARGGKIFLPEKCAILQRT